MTVSISVYTDSVETETIEDMTETIFSQNSSQI